MSAKKKGRSLESIIAKYTPKTTQTATGPRCPFAALGPEAAGLAAGLRERCVTFDEVARIISEEFGMTNAMRGDTVSRHISGKCRCARG